MIKVTVKHESQYFNMEIFAFETIQGFLDRLKKQLKLEMEKQQFGLYLLNYRLLQNEKSFVENKVNYGALLELRVIKQLFVVVVVYKNAPNTMVVDFEEACEKLYQDITRKLKLIPDSFTLKFHSETLDKNKAMTEYKIFANSIITVEQKEDEFVSIPPFNKQSSPFFEQFLIGSEQHRCDQSSLFSSANDDPDFDDQSEIMLNIIQFNGNNSAQVRVRASSSMFISDIEKLTQKKLQLIRGVNFVYHCQILPSNQTLSQLNIPEEAYFFILNQSPEKQFQQQQPHTDNISKKIANIILLIEYNQQDVLKLEVDYDTPVEKLLTFLQEYYKIEQSVYLITERGELVIPNLTLRQSNMETEQRLKLYVISQGQTYFLIHFGGVEIVIEGGDFALVSELETKLKDYLSLQEEVKIFLYDQQLQSNLTCGQLKLQNWTKLSLLRESEIKPKWIEIQINYLIDQIRLEVSLDTSIQDLEEEMKEHFQISSKFYLSLAHDKQQLRSNLTIQQLNVRPYQIFDIVIEQQLGNDEMQNEQLINQPPIRFSSEPQIIELKIMLNLSIVEIEIEDSISIQELIEELVDYPAELLADGKVLQSQQTLKEQNIQHGADLILKKIDATNANVE